MSRMLHAGVPVFLVLLAVLVTPSPTRAEQVLLSLHGSNTIGAKLAPALVQRWLESRGYENIRSRETAPQELSIEAVAGDGEPVEVKIHAHGSSTAFKGLKGGQAHVGMASRPIKGKEAKMLRSMGDLRSSQAELVLGLDGLAVVVNRANPIDRLDVDTLQKIFIGEITDWSQVGGTPGRIQVYARDDKSGTYDTFKSLVLRKRPLVASAKRYESNAELSDDVSADPRGIGFCGLPYVRNSKALAVHEAATPPIRPDAFTVATEDYALSRRLFLYMPPNVPRDSAREFIEFAASDVGQQVVGEVGFVSQGITEGEIEPDPSYPEEYLELTEGAKRLSLNIRFAEGSIKPDNKALRDIDRLVAYVKRPENHRRRVMLFGFADANEIIPIHALDLSINRADALAELLIKHGVAPTRVRGYGQAVMVASNETEEGRIKNRRVEVWLR